jgi:hypothetical protein
MRASDLFLFRGEPFVPRLHAQTEARIVHMQIAGRPAAP